jgi:glycosyltransferase involved in cell wall biosynthesis
MRAYTVPYVAPLLLAARTAGVRLSLDLDDDEILAHGRFASLLESLGRTDEAALAAAEASKYARLENAWLERFNRVYVCTEAHAQRLLHANPSLHVDIVANHITLPRLLPRWPRRGKHILFVGNLSYLPNVLGLLDFVRHGLPRIRARMDPGVTLRIAGGSPAPEVRALAGQAGIELVADPPDLACHYRWADIAVVPVHAGGGTRIKLIEACAHGVPVVSTTLGAEGIPVLDGVHLRLADTHAAFAAACAELLADTGLARRLARQARALVRANHARPLGLERIRSVIGPLPLAS